MTQAPVLSRARARAGGAGAATHPERPAVLWRAAGLLALRTTALGLLVVEVVVLLLWATEQGSTAGAGGALHTGVAVWLSAHHAQLTVAGAHLGVTPYGLTALPALLLWRGGGRVAADSRLSGPRPLLLFAGLLAGSYAAITALLCLLARQRGLSADPAEAFVGAGVLACAAGGLGALRRQAWRPAIPARVRDIARGAAAAGACLVAAAAVTALLTIAVHQAGVTATGQAVAPSVSGKLGLALLDLLAVPTVVIDAAAVLAGPGFQLGVHTSVGLGGVSLGPVPALPVLGALPSGGAYPVVAYLLVVVPVAAGVVGGLRATRGVTGRRELGLRAAAVGGAVGVALAVCAALVGGSAGPGRLSVSGPSPWQVGLAVFGEVGGGALMVAAITALRQHRAAAR